MGGIMDTDGIDGEDNSSQDAIENSVENTLDERDILADSDETRMHAISDFDEESDSGVRGQFVEEESDAFVRGDIDVATQMNRVARAVEADRDGLSDRARAEDPRVPNA
jgi:hypothetical protein